MSRILGIKEIAFDCQPSATHCWGLEQPHRGAVLTSVFCVSVCPSSQGLTGSQPSLVGEMTEVITTLDQYPPALRSHCPWMSSGKFLYTCPATQVHLRGCEPHGWGVWPGHTQPSPGWRKGDRPAPHVQGSRSVQGHLRNSDSPWPGLQPLAWLSPSSSLGPCCRCGQWTGVPSFCLEPGSGGLGPSGWFFWLTPQ